MTKVENELVNEYEKLKKDIFLEKNDAESDKKELKTIDSREVAQMLGKRHSALMKDINGSKDGKTVGIIPTLEKSNFDVSEYFIESTYKTEDNNKTYQCYKVTKAGCELLGNKQQGEKGILFTAKYVKRFNEMEEELKQPKILTPIQQLRLQYQVLEEHNKKIETVEKKVDEIEENLPLLGIDCEELTKEVKKIGVKCLGYDTPAYKDKSLRGKVYSDIYSQIKREFGVNSYKALKRKQLSMAIDFIKEYELPMALADEIKTMNSQVTLEV